MIQKEYIPDDIFSNSPEYTQEELDIIHKYRFCYNECRNTSERNALYNKYEQIKEKYKPQIQLKPRSITVLNVPPYTDEEQEILNRGDELLYYKSQVATVYKSKLSEIISKTITKIENYRLLRKCKNIKNQYKYDVDEGVWKKGKAIFCKGESVSNLDSVDSHKYGSSFMF